MDEAEEFFDQFPSDEEMEILGRFIAAQSDSLEDALAACNASLMPVNQAIIEAMDCPCREHARHMAATMLGWSVQAASILYYLVTQGELVLDGEGDIREAPESVAQLAMILPNLQSLLGEYVMDPENKELLTRLSAAWMEARQACQEIIDQLAP